MAVLRVEAPTNPDIIFHRTPDSSTFPGPPKQPRVLNLTETSIALSWQPDGNSGASPVLAYTLEYFSHDLGKRLLLLLLLLLDW